MSAVVRWAMEMGSVFKHERLNQTWSALTLLPKSIQRLAYEKVFASFVSILPSLLIAGSGLVLTSDEWRLSDFDDDFMLGLFYTLAWLVFGSHLIVYLSLYLKWGAIPVTFVGCVALQVILGLLAMLMGVRGSGEAMVGFWSFILFMGGIALHFLIGKRLQTLASAD